MADSIRFRRGTGSSPLADGEPGWNTSTHTLYVGQGGVNYPINGGTTSPLTTKGDLWGYSATNARLPVGTDGQILTADSTQTLGVKWAAAPTTYTDEMAQDAVGSILADSSTIDFVYNDATNTITASVIDGSLAFSKLQNVTAARLLGRTSASTGSPQEIGLGAGLTMSGATLVCTVSDYSPPVYSPGLYGVLLGRDPADGTGAPSEILIHPTGGLQIAGDYVTVKTGRSITKDAGDGTLYLVGDLASPGNLYFYGTNGSGARGWYAQSTIYTAPVYTQGVLLGRGAASGTGVAGAITVGTRLAMSGTALNVSLGTVATTEGGTGLTSYATGDVVYASAANTLARLAIGVAGKVLTSSGTAPQWSDVPTATTGSGTASATYTVTASWGDTGLSVTLPAAGTYRVTVTAEILANTSGGYGAIDVRLYNVTDAGAVSGSTRRAVVVNGYDRRTMELSWLVTVAASKTVRVEAIRQTISGVPSWTGSVIYGSAGSVADMLLTYVRLS